MIKLKTYIFLSLLIISTPLIPTSASAETCAIVYGNGLYEEALPLCLKAKDNFRIGFIYGKLKDCENMKKYYNLSASANSTGNMGINVLNGTNGCEIDVFSGIKFLNRAVTDNVGYAGVLGDHYRKAGNSKMAKTYYLQSVNYRGSFEWSADRARNSYFELMKIFNEKEKKSFYLDKIRLPSNATDWEDELSKKAINGLQSLLNTKEKLEFFLKDNTSSAKQKCEIGKNLYIKDFQNLVTELTKKNETSAFVRRLCKGDKEYFIGQTFENGLGNKEDFQEAYRLYLISGSNGNVSAKAARDRIRDLLTPEQIQEAVCLADYGIEPSYFGKVRCKF